MGQVGHAAEDVRIPVGDRLVEAEFVIEELFHGEIEFDEVDADQLVAAEDVPEKVAAEGKEERDRQQVPPGKGGISLKGVPGTSAVRISRQEASRILKMDLFHNQIPPQSHELFRGFDEARKIEELGLAVGAMVMVDRHFLESKSEILELFHHFETDGAGGGGEIHLVENGPAHETVVAIHVTQAESEKEPDDVW